MEKRGTETRELLHIQSQIHVVIIFYHRYYYRGRNIVKLVLKLIPKPGMFLTFDGH